MATLSDLDPLLASLNQLKPPGASKGKINSITQLCMNNIQAETSIVQSLYRACKKAPPTHKLGTLYVIDSVVRQWIEQAKKHGQDLHIDGRGEPGTYPAAVKRITELIPALFDDILRGLPEEQKPKLDNVITIWERGNTFPQTLLSEFKSRLSGQPTQTGQQKQNGSGHTNGTTSLQVQTNKEKFAAPKPSRPLHTPTGLPPQYLWDQGFISLEKQHSESVMSNRRDSQVLPQQQSSVPVPAPQPPVQDVNSILANLANLVPKRQAPAGPPQSQAQIQVPSHAPSLAPPPPQQQQQQQQPSLLPPNLPPEIAALLAGQQPQQNGVPQFPSFPPGQPMPPQFSAPPSAGPPQSQMFLPPQGFPGYGAPQPPPSVPQQYAQIPPPQQAPPPAVDPLAPLRGILPANIISDQGKLMQALALLQDLQKTGVPMEQWGPVIAAFNEQQPPSAPEPERMNHYETNTRGARDRSRSPERAPGRRRASPIYGTYEEIAARKQQEEDRVARGGGGGRRFRQRSPMRSPNRNHDSPVPNGVAMNGAPMQPKFIGLDTSLPPDHIKVLSRTLFVGGANGSQADIEALFSRFGNVQTCIANRDKRHAFVKMTTRQFALNAKQGMEHLQSTNDRETMNIARQTKWGVGFGPRECCDYGKGESIIPIGKLTDADHKWLLTAEYGGTGGKGLEGGMVLEEPDIEIGAGVSSKAMSKRVMPDGGPPTNAGGGGHKKQDKGHGHGHGKHDRRNRYGGGARDDAVAYGNGAGVNGGQYDGAGGAAARPVQMESYGYARPEPVAVATPPAVPGFGFSFLPPR